MEKLLLKAAVFLVDGSLEENSISRWYSHTQTVEFFGVGRHRVQIDSFINV
jgi:hypothetical protein